MNREKMEKDRLRERREKHASYAEAGSVVAPDARDSALFQSDTDRFFTDVAAEQRHLRQEMLQRKQADLIRRRADALAREEARWAVMESESKAFEEKTRALQAHGGPALKNKSGYPFDPVTQAYKDGSDGAALRFADERTRWKAAARAEWLSAHSSGPYDPVSGAEVYRYKAPPPPDPSSMGLQLTTQQAIALTKKYNG